MTTHPGERDSCAPDGVTTKSAVQTQSIPKSNLLHRRKVPWLDVFIERLFSELGIDIRPVPGDRPPDCGAENFLLGTHLGGKGCTLARAGRTAAKPPSGLFRCRNPFRAAAPAGKAGINRTRRNAARDASRACLSAGCALFTHRLQCCGLRGGLRLLHEVFDG